MGNGRDAHRRVSDNVGTVSANVATKIKVKEERMAESETMPTENRDASAEGARRQPPRLSPEEVAQLEAVEALEDFMEAPPEGDLAVISDEDVPGKPG